MVRQTITDFLEEQNVPTNSVSCRQELNSHLEKAHPSLILLDLRHGQEDGLDVIMTGHSREEVDRVVGLELSADDYLAKPFGLGELLARVRAVLRRHERGGATRAHDPERSGYRFNGWSLERRTRRLVNPDGAPVSLTNGEYALLLAFLKAPQRPLTREMLLLGTRVREDIFDRSIDVQVLRLRRKLEIDPNAPRVIETERGVGYVFTAIVKPF
jgi:two-component system OmpR family response regulator